MTYKKTININWKIIKEWQKWVAYTREWKLWYRFEICKIDWDILYLKITTWENKWKYSYININELDEFIKFNKN